MTFHSAAWSRSAPRFLHRLQHRTGTIHTGRAEGIARAADALGTSVWPDSLSRLDDKRLMAGRSGFVFGQMDAKTRVAPGERCGRGNLRKLTHRGSRTLLRCEGRWWMAGRFRGMTDPLFRGGNMRLVRTLGLAAGLAMVGSMALAGSALAKPLEHTDFHDEFTETIDDFCEVSGLTVQLDTVEDGRFLFNPHGPDGLAYGHANPSFTNVFTNVANQNTVT